MYSFNRRYLIFLLLILFVGALGGREEVAGQDPPPDLSYLTLHTEHFRVTYPVEVEESAQRVAHRAEAAYALLSESFLPPPSGTIDLLLTDHLDFSNGSAQATPSNRITIWLQPPIEGMDRSYFEDWIDSVVLHEVAHIFHFDLTSPLGKILRTVFGRVPRSWPYFPVHALPDLYAEGAGVHLESLHTGTGRSDGTFFEATLRTRWLEQGVERLDQGLGISPLWPGGDREYLFGALFFDYLSEQYGEEALLHFLRLTTEAWIPFRLDPPARRAFGQSLEELWKEWGTAVVERGEQVQERVANRGGGGELQLLTHSGGMSLYPAARSGGEVAFLRTDGRSDPQIRLWSPEGERFLARWNAGAAPLRWMEDGSLLLSQAEFVDSYRIYRDLVRVSPTGEEVRITHEARVLHADPHPEGEGIAAVLAEGESNRLVYLSIDGEEIRTLREAEPGVLWSHPAWSPDGSRIAVARRRPGGWTAILLLTPEGTLLQEVVENRSLNALPAWGPHGESLVWGSDRSGIPNLYGVRIGVDGVPGELLQVTDLTTAGIFPSIDPEGEWLYLSLLTGEGWEIARTSYHPEHWFPPLPLDPRFESERGEVALPSLPADSSEAGRGELSASDSEDWRVRPYSSLATVLPRYWLPLRKEGVSFGEDQVLPTIWGAKISGSDLLKRHTYAFSLLAPLPSPHKRIEWVGRYTWAGLGNPLFVFDASQEWFLRGKVAVPDGLTSDSLYAVEQERFIGGAVEFHRRRLRESAYLSIGGGRVSQDRSLRTSEGEESDRVMLTLPHLTFGEFRLSSGWSNARSTPFSVSTEKGGAVSLRYRDRRHLSLSSSLSDLDGSFREVVGTLRGYLPIPLWGYANHVLAVRMVGGAATGPGARGGHFALGGHSSVLPVRGFPIGALRSDAGWALSGEWRFPIGFLHRGLGPWPLYLDRLAGSVFVDLAGAIRGESHGEVRGSVGVEMVLFHSILFDEIDRVRVGVVLPTLEGEDVSVYLRSGWSF